MSIAREPDCAFNVYRDGIYGIMWGRREGISAKSMARVGRRYNPNRAAYQVNVYLKPAAISKATGSA